MTAVADLTWDALEARLKKGAPALLPLGAGAKEHGLHLPMGTDALQAEWLAGRVAQRSGALVWPVLTYGYYPAFRDFPGSITLSATTFEAVLAEIAEEILRWRPRGLFLIDTGVSTNAPAARALAPLDGAHHLIIHAGERYRAAAARLETQRFGSHADELETARLLAIAPDRVDMARAQATPTGPFDGPLTRSNAPSGSYGDPTPATAEMGAELVTAMVEDLVEAVDRGSGTGRAGDG